MKKGLFLFCWILLFTGCGSDDKSRNTPNYYDGPTGAAEFTTDNAVSVVDYATNMTSLQSLFLTGLAKPRVQRQQFVARAIFETTTQGECGGKVVYSVEENGEFFYTYTDYCKIDNDVENVKNGYVKIKTIDAENEEYSYEQDIVVTRESYSSKSFGTLHISQTANGEKMVFNMSASDTETLESFSIENYTIEESDSDDYFSVSGTVCSSEYGGCIVVETLTPFVADNTGFSAGKMTISSGTSEIRVEVNAESGDCSLTLSTDGTDFHVQTANCINYL